MPENRTLAFVFLDFSEHSQGNWLQLLEWANPTEVWERTTLKSNDLLFSSLIFLNNFHGHFRLMQRDGFLQTRPGGEGHYLMSAAQRMTDPSVALLPAFSPPSPRSPAAGCLRWLGRARRGSGTAGREAQLPLPPQRTPPGASQGQKQDKMFQ
ncbi:hypothetical protein HJG60_010398 [Phyllostomus discolor]|uniref:Uncharacterized protein n=1 Tax=Phyllostomus discolor TaxID=89673 RepID=A0A834ASV4_9CHIR|nr:hypothetical protein HJG60_010398 [Phyllostomus discolor]